MSSPDGTGDIKQAIKAEFSEKDFHRRSPLLRCIASFCVCFLAFLHRIRSNANVRVFAGRT